MLLSVEMGYYCTIARGTMEIMSQEGHIMQPKGSIMWPEGGIIYSCPREGMY